MINQQDATRAFDVLGKILAWSRSLEPWKRDALRRLVTVGGLDDEDIEELAYFCKGTHGLEQLDDGVIHALEDGHLPEGTPGEDPVTLTSLKHHRGVNALAAGQTLEFGPGLTIVYGSNAAGKSGYTRILKRACRARGREDILGNVFEQKVPTRPLATIGFKVGKDDDSFGWTDEDEKHEQLGHVSVFDTYCATVYLKEKTDVAFRPFGLDLFDSLSDACENVKRLLERERRELSNMYPSLPRLIEGTAAHRIVDKLTSLTKESVVRELATLSRDEERSLRQARKQLKDLDAKDPSKAAKVLSLLANRLSVLARHLEAVEQTSLSYETLFEARDRLKTAQEAVLALRSKSFPENLLDGSGGDLWRLLWEAARQYSEEEAYPDDDFPVTEAEARCVLCQQELNEDTGERLAQFEAFLESTAQQQRDKATRQYKDLFEEIRGCVPIDEDTADQIAELRLEDEDLAAATEGHLEELAEQKKQVLAAIHERLPAPEGLPDEPIGFGSVIDEEVVRIRERSKELRKAASPKRRQLLREEIDELEARETLGEHLDTVLEEIERQKKLNAYAACIRETNTRGITKKSTELTKKTVTGKLAAAFKDEIRKIGLKHLEVELQDAGGARGALYHRLILKRAPSAKLFKIASEGESRALAIAAFFSELSTASHNSAVLFDDPVSSLDHVWRENVAKRLAEEAQKRQVIIFTHDITFVLALVAEADSLGTVYKHQHVRNERNLGAGISIPELPWVAMGLKSRIGVLNNRWQAADKIFRKGTQVEYEPAAIEIYGLMRKAWERGIEEVLLGGIIQRYRRDIQTKHVRQLLDITENDCKALEDAMTKCSRWLHDQAPAENPPVPEPDEIRKDIDDLVDWWKSFKKRR